MRETSLIVRDGEAVEDCLGAADGTEAELVLVLFPVEGDELSPTVLVEALCFIEREELPEFESCGGIPDAALGPIVPKGPPPPLATDVAAA